MKYLLDTHTLLWHARDAPELPTRIRHLLDDEAASDQLVVSVTSFYEIAIKVAVGKLPLPGGFDALLARIARSDMRRLSITDDHLRTYCRLPFVGDHRDPFDRLLVAQALTEELTLISCDAKMRLYPGLTTIW